MSTPVPPTRLVRCPGCGGPSVYSIANPNRPFCSPRCKHGDLGAWANEQYRVAVQPKDDPDEPLEPPR